MAHRLGPIRGLRRRAVTTATATLVGLLVVPMATAYGAAPVSSSPSACTVDAGNASVHFTIATSATPPEARVTAVRISGLSVTGCTDNVPARLTIKGTPSGDPTTEPTETLTTLNSTLDPCTGKPLAVPGYVTDGAITLTTCATGGRGGYADAHDATRLVLHVAGRSVHLGASAGHMRGAEPGTEVLGEKFTHAAPARGGQAAPAGASGLPFTGGWIGPLLGAALLALVVGALLTAWASERRRRSLG